MSSDVKNNTSEPEKTVTEAALRSALDMLMDKNADELKKIPDLENLAMDGVYIAYWCPMIGPTCARYWEWRKLATQGTSWGVKNLQVLGVAVFPDGHEPFIISPYESGYVRWSQLYEEDQFDEYYPHVSKACTDFDGLEHFIKFDTYNQSNTISGDSNECAFLWAQMNGGTTEMQGVAFHWYLPTLGQLSAMMKHRDAINRCLREISGATPLGTDLNSHAGYWSSTQYNRKVAWCVHLNGAFMPSEKIGNYYAVRPVMDFAPMSLYDVPKD